MTHTSEKTDKPAIHNESDITEPTKLVTAMLPARRRSNERVMSVTL